MNNAIAFTKWFLVHYKQEQLIDLLDQNAWNSFILSDNHDNHAIVDDLIPQLLQNKPKSKPKPKSNKKFKVDAQTNTSDQTITPDPDVPTLVPVTLVPVTLVPDQPIKNTKKRSISKKTKEPVVDDKPVDDQTTAPVTLVTEVPIQINKKINSKKNGIDHNSNIDDIVIPDQELIHTDQLSTESFDSHTSLVEVFVNDVLFYFDNKSLWFDANLIPVNDPTI